MKGSRVHSPTRGKGCNREKEERRRKNSENDFTENVSEALEDSERELQ